MDSMEDQLQEGFSVHIFQVASQRRPTYSPSPLHPPPTLSTPSLFSSPFPPCTVCLLQRTSQFLHEGRRHSLPPSTGYWVPGTGYRGTGCYRFPHSCPEAQSPSCIPSHHYGVTVLFHKLARWVEALGLGFVSSKLWPSFFAQPNLLLTVGTSMSLPTDLSPTLAPHTCAPHLRLTLAPHTCAPHLCLTLEPHTCASHLHLQELP